MGYWPPGPVCPSAQTGSAATKTFPLTPAKEANTGGCYTGAGQIGSFVNGVAIFDGLDAQSYNNQGIWHSTAMSHEVYDLDICLGHAANGVYHHHSWSPCLQARLGDDGSRHSPIYGWLVDGYPLYGPYQASGQLAQSCWKARDYTNGMWGCSDGARSCVLKDPLDYTKGTTSVQAGPSLTGTVHTLSGNVIPSGSGIFLEDFYFDSQCYSQGGAGLNHNNGHDHDGLGWHYHLTIDGANQPVYPFIIGQQFYGCLPAGASCSSSIGGSGGGGGPPAEHATALPFAHAKPKEARGAKTAQARRAQIMLPPKPGPGSGSGGGGTGAGGGSTSTSTISTCAATLALDVAQSKCLTDSYTPCPAGTYYSSSSSSSSSGSTACAPCPVGSYSSSTGMSVCTACSAGYYQPSSGQQSCSLQVPPGSFGTTSGASGYSACAAGYYSASSGATQCTPCSSGFYNSDSAATACAIVPAGYYASTYQNSGNPSSSAAQGYSARPANSYAPISGSVACSPCTKGYYYTSSTGATSCNLVAPPSLYPTAIPTLNPTAGAVTLSAALSFSGLTAAVFAADTSGSIASALQLSVADALGITNTQLATGRATIGKPVWSFAATTITTTRSISISRRLSSVATAAVAISAFADDLPSSSLQGSSSADAVSGLLSQQGATIAAAVQASAGGGGLTLGFLGAAVAVVSSPPSPSPSSFMGSPSPKPTKPNFAPSPGGSAVAIIVGTVVGVGGGCLLLAAIVAYLRSSSRGSTSEEGGKVQTLDGVYSGAMVDVEGEGFPTASAPPPGSDGVSVNSR